MNLGKLHTYAARGKRNTTLESHSNITTALSHSYSSTQKSSGNP